MKLFRENIRWNRLSAFLLAILLTLGSFAALYTGLFPDPFVLEADAATAETYYNGLNTSLKGSAFRSELANLITSTHTHQTSYDELRTVFKTADADPNKSGNIIWFYTGTSKSFNGSFGSSAGTTNREHVWPKDGGDAFPASSQAGSDAHHLRPTESVMNSSRGSKSFGEVPQTTSNIVKEGTSTTYGSTPDELCYSNSSYFYPAKGYRGATARILFYVQVRWGDAYGLSFVLGPGNCKTIGDIETLMKWHLEEPPTEEEIRRNEVIFGIQGNRNPFIDHPEYAAQIFCYDGKSYNDELQAVVAQYGDYTPPTEEKVTSVTLPVSTLTLAPGASYTLTPTVTPAGIVHTLGWYTDDGSILSVNQSGKITAVGTGTANVYVYCVENPEALASVKVTVSSATVEPPTPPPTTESITVNRASFTGSGSYAWQTWTSGSISGKAYMYAGNKTQIQMNKSQSSHYLFNTTPLSGGIVSITVKLSSGTDPRMELLTSQTPYSEGSGAPSTGTSHGTKTVTEAGVTWTLSTTDPYFSLNHVGSKAIYIDSIVITYGGSGCAQHSFTEHIQYPSFDKAGSVTKTCSACGDQKSETLPVLDSTHYTVSENGTLYTYVFDGAAYEIRPMRFYAASVTVSDAYELSFRIPASSFTGVGVTAYTVRLESADGTLGCTYTDGYAFARDGGYYYAMRGINPDRLGDRITATVRYTVNGTVYTSEKTYSIGEFCYARLDTVTDSNEARMLVDLLNYGAAAQVYTGYNTGALVNASLTNAQKALGTQTPAAYTDVTNTAHTTVQNPSVTWKSAGMFLSQTVRMSFRITAASTAGLSVRITVGTDSYTVTSFTANGDGTHTFFFENLGFTRLDETMYLTVMQNGTAVSNTLAYSAASYAAGRQDSTTDPALSALVDAMMSFGRALKVWSK